jgi:hypothetical protein
MSFQTADRFSGLQHRMSRAQLTILPDVFRFGAQLLLDLLGAGADDHKQSPNSRVPKGIRYVSNHRLAAKRMQDFMKVGLHPGS